jgi:hypothetical protein
MKTGILLWIASCLLPSALTSYMEMLSISDVPGFHMSIGSAIGIALILTVVIMIYTIPVIGFVWFKLKRKRLELADVLHSNIFLLVYSVTILSANYYLMLSLYEALYITLPTVFLSLISLNLFLWVQKRQLSK